MMTGLFVAVLVLWSVLSLLRFVDMYDLSSPYQRFRRFDWFKLVPIGAFFGPEPPPVDYAILVRDLHLDGTLGDWTEVPRVRPRRLWHGVWNPQKHLYKARNAAARGLILAAERHGLAPGAGLSPTFMLSEPYLTVLRLVSELPRISRVRGTQFAVLETDVVQKTLSRSVLSVMHEVSP